MPVCAVRGRRRPYERCTAGLPSRSTSTEAPGTRAGIALHQVVDLRRWRRQSLSGTALGDGLHVANAREGRSS